MSTIILALKLGRISSPEPHTEGKIVLNRFASKDFFYLRGGKYWFEIHLVSVFLGLDQKLIDFLF